METIKIDYESKGVDFYYIYKPLSHPEYQNYVSPVNIEERLMHIVEAKRRLGSSFSWLADTMDNDWHTAMGRTPNSELLLDPDGRVVARRAWSIPGELRKDMERLLGPVENPTKVSDLDLPTAPPAPTVVKGIVPRVEMPPGMSSIHVEPLLEASRVPFYAKIRAEADPALLSSGKGIMYLGFHLDPLYRVHWNNEAGPVRFEFSLPDGVTMTPSTGMGPDVEEPADADPREFLLAVDMAEVYQPLELDVFYYACDDALTFCIPVNQSYRVHLERDHHGLTKRMSANNEISAPRPRRQR